MALLKVIYARLVREERDSWLIADTKPAGLSEKTPVLIGEYKLVRTLRVSRETKVEPVE